MHLIADGQVRLMFALQHTKSKHIPVNTIVATKEEQEALLKGYDVHLPHQGKVKPVRIMVKVDKG